MGKFDAIQTDEDTTVLSRIEGKLDGRDVLHESWVWERIRGESFIFCEEDVRDLSDEAIINMVKSSPAMEPGSDPTFTRADSGFVFVNFNFHEID